MVSNSTDFILKLFKAFNNLFSGTYTSRHILQNHKISLLIHPLTRFYSVFTTCNSLSHHYRMKLSQKNKSFSFISKIGENLRLSSEIYMSRKVTYGYRYNAEKVKRKGTVRSKIYFDMWKDKEPYYLIHKFLYENDPENPDFKYDIDLARKVKCKRNIFAHYKKDNKLRFFWYASRKNKAKGPCSRYINFAIDRNEFRFSKLHSFFHILPYVHKHYKHDPRYIYFMNRFLSRHGRIAQFKRTHHNQPNSNTNSNSDNSVDLGDPVDLGDKVKPGEVVNTVELGDTVNSTNNKFNTNTIENSELSVRYNRGISWKEIKAKAKREEEELYSKISTEPIEVDLGDGRSFKVKKDGFSVFGEFYSKIDKKKRKTPFDIYSPFLRTKHSSKRRRFREKIPLDPKLRFKTRRERILHNAKSRNVKDFVKRFLKQIPPQKDEFDGVVYTQESLINA